MPAGVPQPDGQPCRHLRGDDRCGVHGELRERGFPGCEALTLPVPAELADELTRTRQSTRDMADSGPAELAALDVPPHRRTVGALLQRASEHVRAGLPQAGVDRRGADLMGASSPSRRSRKPAATPRRRSRWC